MSGAPASKSYGLPSHGTIIATIAGVTLKRVMRGAMIWVGLVCAILPALLAAAQVRLGNYANDPTAAADAAQVAFSMELVLLALVTSLVVAWPVGDEIDDRTATYLWSRPLARWTILAGKLTALVPVVVAIFVFGWVAVLALSGAPFAPLGFVALVLGSIVCSFAAAALALVMPKHPLAISLVALALVDQPLGAMPASINLFTISHHVRVLAGYSEGSTSTAAIGLVVLGAIWLWIALGRIHRTQL